MRIVITLLGLLAGFVGPCAVTDSDLRLAIDGPAPGFPGDDATCVVRDGNRGPEPARAAILDLALPADRSAHRWNGARVSERTDERR